MVHRVSRPPSAPHVGYPIIDPKMTNYMMVRTQPLVFRICNLKSMVKLLAQGHHVMRLGDRLELSAHEARLLRSRLEFQTRRGNPAALASGSLAANFTTDVY